MDLTHTGLPYTVVSVYAPAVAAERQAYFLQELLPSLPADRHLIMGGDFNCIAGQQDLRYSTQRGKPGSALRDTGQACAG